MRWWRIEYCRRRGLCRVRRALCPRARLPRVRRAGRCLGPYRELPWCKAVGDQAALGVSRRVETLRLDRGVGRDPAIGRPEAVAAFEPPAVALGVEVGGPGARSLRVPAPASGSTRQQVLTPGVSLARTRTRA